ncbi:cupin domain-containing protein [Tahibacter sp.]|uniref:cupin domain-containing protein n=1 Tax=Tahibacter sp. TaxID=2056211 RepID=UPI0028C49076|nr:cupin domain-containing protein [Tahibacter sp.]
MSTPIEVQAGPGQPLGMSTQDFLRDYWQKRPLLIRCALADFAPPLTPEDLAGLACEEAALSRLIVRDPAGDSWSVRSGPFDDADFAQLPESHWTLLVQDVDKWDMDVSALLERFRFLPRWRVDDVMISYAVDGGGVGAHVDQYDVFLVQGLGRRRWRISDDARAPKTFRPELELKILAEFTPTHDWVLEPGDMLYLPPGFAHDGVAVGDCMTFSVGMRAPALAEMLGDLVDTLVEPLSEDDRYTDADLAPAADPYEIDAASLSRVEHAVAALREMDNARLHDWFGRYITSYRCAQTALAPPRIVTATELDAALARGAGIVRFPWARTAWLDATPTGRADCAGSGDATLYVAGSSHICSGAFARLICEQREIAATELQTLGGADKTVLLALVNQGQLVLTRPQRRSRR